MDEFKESKSVKLSLLPTFAEICLLKHTVIMSMQLQLENIGTAVNNIK